MGLTLVCGVCLQPIDPVAKSEKYKAGHRICESCNESMSEEEVRAEVKERMKNVTIVADHPLQ
ncbi:hypothetical protein PUW24_06105 [Paenibacillus urinalis]|uniref:Inhibitor of sigma-G Gin n=1 Tax=Paenibacillus urinalis TaxID=521520 RepID=A0AAX3N197_9BACL|nr:hypothetical protein [Paenibacillus urinalis]WDH82439.1 hypothetical protein PUW23_23835 [Paenibacillus urinalis]WDH98496.1 hypothetical protein PUW24_06105 [Paenibacillus urinalis]WDI02187.1 hypothetical protein PUW25_23830 [Paenibacillus urinalis]